MYKVTHPILMFSVCISCSIPLTSLADRIEGIVSPIPPAKTFEVLDKNGDHIKLVDVNDRGEFTVYLPPGLYQIKSDSGKATIRSEKMPMRNQRITFEK